jgi:hypothetical protein
MPPKYKLSPTFIAMMLNNNRKDAPPTPARSGDAVRPGDASSGPPEPHFTPLEEILGERPAAAPAPPSAPTFKARPEPQLNLPTIGDVWQQMQAEKHRTAAASTAMWPPRSPTGNSVFATPGGFASVNSPLGSFFGSGRAGVPAGSPSALDPSWPTNSGLFTSSVPPVQSVAQQRFKPPANLGVEAPPAQPQPAHLDHVGLDRPQSLLAPQPQRSMREETLARPEGT